jgi:WD40 repeat protein/tetratricopeptide (TPR) repeat protein
MSELEDIAVQNQEAIAEIAWTLNASRGQFSLVFARCNYAQVRDRMIAELRGQFSGILVWNVPVGSDAVLEGLLAVLADFGTVPDGVMVTGLEGVKDLEGVLAKINRGREEWRSACEFPVVLWLTDQGLRSLMRFAPDFESWGGTTRFEISMVEITDWLNTGMQEWMSWNASGGLLSPGYFAALEREFNSMAEQFNNYSFHPSSEFTFSWNAILGGVYLAQWKSDQAIDSFQKSLQFWNEGVWTEGRAKVMRDLIQSYYIKTLDQRDRSHPDWINLNTAVEKYLDFCDRYFPEHPIPEIPSSLGDILVKLEKWSTLKSLAQQNSDKLIGREDNPLTSRTNGFLAEVALVEKNWKEAILQAEKALEKLKKTKASDDFCQPVQEGMISLSHNTVKILEPWYKLLLARAEEGLGNFSSAISKFELVKIDLMDIQHSPWYLEVLKDLERLYRSQNNYLKSFEVKQERFSVEQQMGIRSFVGAGWLKAEQALKLNAEKIGMTFGPDEVATAIRSSGRLQDLDRLLSRIGSTEHKLTVLHGASGVGKSSLVTAGLVPALLEKSIGLRVNKPVLIRQYTNWKESILESIGEVRSESDLVMDILKKLDWNEEHNVRTVLIFDQFEEFFFVLGDRTERQEFYTFLGQAIKLLNVKVILSMREDYLHYLLECRKTPGMERVNDGDVLGRLVLYEIGNFSPSDARSIIEDLTTRSQLTWEPTLIDRLVKDLTEPLGEVRPIELQIVGAQLQAKGIRTLAKYPEGGKSVLVGQYLTDVIGDCGTENEELAWLTVYLLTDERKMRPLKTRLELERELEELPQIDRSALDLVLAVFVGSGLVLRELRSDRFQLVHDYLAGVIHDLQKPRWKDLYDQLAHEKKRNDSLAEKQRNFRQKSLLSLILFILSFQIFALFYRKDVTERELKDFTFTTDQIFKNGNKYDAIVRSIDLGNRLKRSWFGVPFLQEFFIESDIRLSAMTVIKQLQINLVELNSWNGHNDSVTSIALNAGGDLVASASFDGTIKGWNLDGKEIFIVDSKTIAKKIQEEGLEGQNKVKLMRLYSLNEERKPSLQISSIKYSPDGKYIAVIRNSKIIEIFNANTNKLLTVITKEDKQDSFISFNEISFSPDSNTIASANSDSTISIWSIKSKKIDLLAVNPQLQEDLQELKVNEISIFKGHTKQVNSIEFSPNGKYLVSGSDDNIVKLWDMKGKKIDELSPNGNSKEDKSSESIKRVRFSPRGTHTISASSSGQIKLWNLNENTVRSQTGQGTVTTLAFSGNGQYIASNSYGIIKIWDYSLRELQSFKGHDSLVNDISFAIDNQKIISGSADKSIKIWKIDTATFPSEDAHTGFVNSISFSPDGKSILTAGRDSTVKIWQIDSDEVKTLFRHVGDIKKVGFSPDNQTIISISDQAKPQEGPVYLWSRKGEFLKDIRSFPYIDPDFQFSEDSKLLMVRDKSSSVGLWNMNAQEVQRFGNDENRIGTVSFINPTQEIASHAKENLSFWDKDGQLLRSFVLPQDDSFGEEKLFFGNKSKIVARVEFKVNVKKNQSDPDSGSAILNIYDLTGQLVRSFNIGENIKSAPRIIISPDGKSLLSVNQTVELDKSSTLNKAIIKIFDLDGNLIRTLSDQIDAERLVKYSEDGKLIATVSTKNEIMLWTQKGEEISRIKGYNSGVYTLEFSRDGKYIAAGGSGQSNAKLWDISGNLLRTFPRYLSKRHQYSANSISISRNGMLFASSGSDQTIRLWDRQGKILQTFLGHSETVNSIAFSPDGKILASGSDDNTIKLWNTSNGNEIRTLRGHEQGVKSIRFSSNGQQLISGSHDKTLRLWDLEKQSSQIFKGHEDSVNSVGFSPDGKSIVSASSDKSIKFWSLDGKNNKTLLGHSEAVRGVTFSLDGKLIASSSDDKSIKLWRTDGTLYETFNVASNSVNSVDFSLDSKMLLASSSDGNMSIWNLQNNNLIQKVTASENNQILDAKFSPDNKLIISADSSGSVVFWDFNNLDALLRQGCSKIRTYLKSNSTVQESDRKICDEIPDNN